MEIDARELKNNNPQQMHNNMQNNINFYLPL